ncbi:MAG: hypothetical protein WD601_12530, partial [Pseudohongiellaceae bacterium]
NEFNIAYISGRIPEYDKISLDARDYLEQLGSGDFFAVESKSSETLVRELIEARDNLVLIASFANERDDRVEIFHHQ